MRVPRPHALLLAAATLLGPSIARAEGTTPAEAGRRALAALAAPSERHAFAVDLDLYFGASRLGGGHVSAAPETADDRALWRTTEGLRIGGDAAPQLAFTARSALGGDLRLLEATREERSAEGEESTRATRTGKGFHVVHTKGGEPDEKDVDAAAETVSSGLASMVLFLRQVPAEAAEYEVAVWDDEARGVQTRRLSVKGAGRMKDARLGLDAEALWAVASGGKSTIEVYVDPKDRAFLGFHILEQGFWATRKGLVPAPDAAGAPDLSKPAGSAKGVGTKFALGLLTGNAAALEASVHWPSVAADVRSRGAAADDATLKSLLLARMKGGMRNFDLATAWGIVKGAAEGAEVTDLGGGAVRVRFAPPMQAVGYVAKAFDASGWLITAMETPGAARAK